METNKFLLLCIIILMAAPKSANGAFPPLCGRALMETLTMVCSQQDEKDYVIANNSEYSDGMSSGGIIQECCVNTCNKEVLLSYC
ncbi:hypothetical protein O3G_MSEX014572 [Manduca sexta]|uniref:Insulin-like domain-containing protein n=1 Tax=Manduca sexta TaxID=7130 RepID=A0A921ZW04_MANSE|nr:hypothetical protein O3G_MSEX014572 [Manduca sexta]KAG6464516.1 hypothetical protein O3G_MSEX014572 [Manduca sexta]